MVEWLLPLIPRRGTASWLVPVRLAPARPPAPAQALPTRPASVRPALAQLLVLSQPVPAPLVPTRLALIRLASARPPAPSWLPAFVRPPHPAPPLSARPGR